MGQKLVESQSQCYRSYGPEALVDEFARLYLCTKQQYPNLDEMKTAARREILRRMNLGCPAPPIVMRIARPGVHEVEPPFCDDEVGIGPDGRGPCAADYESELRSQQGGPDPDRSSDFQGF